MTAPPFVTTLLGVDLGERRIGLATGDSITGAVPLATIPRGRDVAADAVAIRQAVAAGRVRVDELVVGLPLERRSGDEGTQATLTRAWAEAIAPLLGLPLTLRDERLSSQLAEERLGPMTRGRSGGPPTAVQRDRYRARIDREAAAIILEAELQERSGADARAAEAGAAHPTNRRPPRRADTEERA